MAKITLKNFDELAVSEERAQAIYEFLEEKRAEEKDGGLPLNMFPITIETLDNGLWVGNLGNIGQISIQEKKKTYKHTFKSEETLVEFHNKYGYGGNTDKFEPGFGLLDVQTQFLIGTGQAKIEDSKLVMIPCEKKEYWDDLWHIYKSRLDVFNELEA